jgi:uncharacterized OB-fold protein
MTRLDPQPSLHMTITVGTYSEPFWAGCQRDKLTYQRCGDCDLANFDPAPACRRCLSRTLSWQDGAGLGRLVSWTVVWRPPTAAFRAPYAPALVRLDEGYHMIANLIGCTIDDIRPDLPVRAVFFDGPAGQRLPYFTPRTS